MDYISAGKINSEGFKELILQGDQPLRHAFISSECARLESFLDKKPVKFVGVNLRTQARLGIVRERYDYDVRFACDE
ncbi:hypothetical protein HED60_11475 [Planctomycetales bacterium ZRK34]|nr:hypothetical protein HED60_11475 [Planctomycetales bacterium ZRK34]